MDGCKGPWGLETNCSFPNFVEILLNAGWVSEAVNGGDAIGHVRTGLGDEANYQVEINIKM